MFPSFEVIFGLYKMKWLDVSNRLIKVSNQIEFSVVICTLAILTCRVHVTSILAFRGFMGGNYTSGSESEA